MISYTVTHNGLFDQKAEGAIDAYGFFVTHNAFLPEQLPLELQEFQDTFYPDLSSWLRATQFVGKEFEVKVIPVIKNQKLIHAIFVGLGETDGTDLYIETYRRALGLLVRTATQHKSKSLAFNLPDPALFDIDLSYLAKQTSVIAQMANYHFTDFITSIENKTTDLEIIIGVQEKNSIQKSNHPVGQDFVALIDAGLREGIVIGKAVNKARHWIDLPPSDLTPHRLASEAREIARDTGLPITVFSEEEINKMGMGGLAGVSRGSELDCELVIMEYKTDSPDAPTIAFVGKGITFDSGGLSLKPAASMETMKDDMSGAAAVIAVMEALAALKPKVNVIGLAAIAENLPSGKALKPGDIVRFYNGKTAEIKNTDAEGRLILADALSYAVKHYKLDAVIDIATLTGACPIALGPYFTGLMSQHEELIELLYEASDKSGDRIWELPLDDDFKPAIKSSVADLANIGERKYGGSVITAAFFLQPFVDKVPWAHLDIAGTAFDVPDISYYRPGATGAGVRLLIELALNW